MQAYSHSPSRYRLAFDICHVSVVAAMRLLRVADDLSLQFEEFYDDSVPPYAILSHTWGVGEVMYEEMCDGAAEQKNGYAKILGCAEKALSHDLEYIWVDTCCKSPILFCN